MTPRATELADGIHYHDSHVNEVRNNYAIREQNVADYIVFKDGSTYYGEHCASSGIDYSGTNAASVIESCLLVLPDYGTLKIKGTTTLTQALNINGSVLGSSWLTVDFDYLYFTGNIDGVVLSNINRPMRLRGREIANISVTHDKSLVKLDNSSFAQVDVGWLTGDYTNGKSIGTYLTATTGESLHNNRINIRNTSYCDKVLYLNLLNNAWASVNKFDMGYFEAQSPRQIHIYKSGADSIHNNTISGVGGAQGTWNPQAHATVYAIKMETAAGGTIHNTRFDDFHVYSAVDEVYRADSGVVGTKFIGGMMRSDQLAMWHDAGTFTDIISDWTSARNYTRLGSCGQAIEHHAASDTLTTEEAGTVHTNLGAGGNIKLTLPQTTTAGTQFEFAVMAVHQLQIDPGAAGALYINGAKQADNAHIWADDEAESVKLVADGNGDWIAIGMVGTWTVV